MEGTALFDAVRPSLDLDGAYASQDIRLIALWKRDGIKDGRALVRWALSFTDRSTIAGQMQLVNDMNALKLSAPASTFELSEHLANLFELWRALSSSDRSAPASFFRQLCISLPTAPEGPLVHMRRYLVDLVDEGTSPLLRDIDGENGLLARLLSYAKSHGLHMRRRERLPCMRSTRSLLQQGGERARRSAASARPLRASGKVASAYASTTQRLTSTRSPTKENASM